MGKCRVCGCTDHNACVTEDGPCWWVKEGLCSACAKEGDSELKGIKFTRDKNGKKRAYYYSREAMRWFPIAVDEAELLISTGEAYEVPPNALFA